MKKTNACFSKCTQQLYVSSQFFLEKKIISNFGFVSRLKKEFICGQLKKRTKFLLGYVIGHKFCFFFHPRKQEEKPFKT